MWAYEGATYSDGTKKSLLSKIRESMNLGKALGNEAINGPQRSTSKVI